MMESNPRSDGSKTANSPLIDSSSTKRFPLTGPVMNAIRKMNQESAGSGGAGTVMENAALKLTLKKPYPTLF
jgi:hypothetical protein